MVWLDRLVNLSVNRWLGSRRVDSLSFKQKWSVSGGGIGTSAPQHSSLMLQSLGHNRMYTSLVPTPTSTFIWSQLWHIPTAGDWPRSERYILWCTSWWSPHDDDDDDFHIRHIPTKGDRPRSVFTCWWWFWFPYCGTYPQREIIKNRVKQWHMHTMEDWPRSGRYISSQRQLGGGGRTLF